MGFDYFWHAVEPDLKVQKRASWFLESWARANDCACAVYNERVDGYFLDLDATRYPPENGLVEKTSRHFVGVSLDGDPDSVSWFPQMAEHQKSFVFDNTEGAGNELITLEPISSFDLPKYKIILSAFSNTPMKPQEDFYAVFRRRSSTRLGGTGFGTLLHWLQEEWLPTLEWIGECEDEWPIEYDPDVYEREFSPRVLDPRFQFRWR